MASLSSNGGIFTVPTSLAATCLEYGTTEVGASVGAVSGVILLAIVAWVVILQKRLARGTSCLPLKMLSRRYSVQGENMTLSKAPQAKLPKINPLPELGDGGTTWRNTHRKAYYSKHELLDVSQFSIKSTM